MRRQSWATVGTLAAVVLGLSALHVWWLYRFRNGFAVDIDEAGYMWFAFHLNDAVREDGLVGLWNGIQGEGWVGPLLPGVTALAQLVAGARSIVPSRAVQLVFFAVLVYSSYGIGRALLDRRAGLLTAVTFAALPRLLSDSERGWLTVNDHVVAALQAQQSPELRLDLATAEPLLNVSAVRLASLRRGVRGGIFEPVATGGEDTVGAYWRFLADRRSNALVTVSAQGPHFGPTVTQKRVESAAASLGFVRQEQFALPDGRQLYVWVLAA